jgi:hypothetical protein
MATALSASGSSIPSRLGEMAGAVSRLGYDLLVDCLGRLVWFFPLALAGCAAVCLGLTAVAALLVRNGAGPQGWICLAILVLCHVTAAAVWAVQRALDGGARAALDIINARLSEIFDLLIAPLVEAGEERVPRFSIAQVREHFQQTAQTLLVNPSGSSWRAWANRLVGFVVRWWLRTELAMVESALATLERRGETHVSLDALKNVVRDEALARGRSLALANLWQWELAAAIIVLVLLAAPAVILWGIA